MRRFAEQVLVAPRIILFDWHATLVDTLDAVYHAIDDMLVKLDELGLADRLTKPEFSKTKEDAKLVDYVRVHKRLHPKIKAAKKVSRTDIFEVLFGPDERAKHIAHLEYDRCYQRHYGEVHPFEQGAREHLVALKQLGVRLGVATNRNKTFLAHELEILEGGSWRGLFEVMVSGDEAGKRKPSPDTILAALARFNAKPGLDSWYVGDSTTDTVAAKEAGITSVFYNGAHWDQAWLNKIFPGTAAHPYQPDAVVETLGELLERIKICLKADTRP